MPSSVDNLSVPATYEVGILNRPMLFVAYLLRVKKHRRILFALALSVKYKLLIDTDRWQ